MQVNIGAAVGVCDLLIVDFGEPVVGRDGAGVAQNEPADRIGHGGVLLDPPVRKLYIAVHHIFIVQNGRLHIAYFFALLAVQDIALGDIGVAGLNQD
ncbi:hypothetical protein SDC9_87208 [bioreactor metagenome]|uniref:Uncharacterized protein n=1 Tax=bioreactor metagenome TaxID=1076179 RepID=A0A644ZSJ1_9ZZZZ